MNNIHIDTLFHKDAKNFYIKVMNYSFNPRLKSTLIVYGGHQRYFIRLIRIYVLNNVNPSNKKEKLFI